MARGTLYSLVGRLRGREEKEMKTLAEPGEEGVIIEPFTSQERLYSLQRNAGRVITDAIAKTPERWEDSVRRGIAISLAEDGQPRTQAINFFNTYVAPVLAEYAEELEERRGYIIRVAFMSARANPLYRGAMIAVEATAKQVRGDRTWSIEQKVNEFVTQQRWEERYVPIIRKYME